AMDCRRYRDFDARIPKPEHANGSARVLRDGVRRGFFRKCWQTLATLASANSCDHVAGCGGNRHRLFWGVWSNFELRSDCRFHLFRNDSGIAVRFAPASGRVRHSYLSCTRPPIHDDSFCFGVCWNCRKRYRRFTAEQRNRVGYHAGSAPDLLLLEEVQTSRSMTHKQSEYMHWSKTQSRARFNLATSGVAPFPLRDLPVQLETLEINGYDGYGHPPLQKAIASHHGVDPDCVVESAGTSMAN